jgi:hypothetical protein
VSVAALVLAIVGAATGVAALCAQVWQFVLSGPHIKVIASNSMTTGDQRWYLGIEVVNRGRLSVTVQDVGIVVDAPKPGTMPVPAMSPAWWNGPALPQRLPDGESLSWYVEPSVVALNLKDHQARKDARVYVRLATNKTVRSRNRIDVLNLAQIAAQR